MFEKQEILAEREVDAAEIYALEHTQLPLSAPPVAPHNAGFQLPSDLWMMMFGSYAIFFAVLFIATGGSSEARFAIIVSVLYAIIYFGGALIGAGQAGQEDTSPLQRGEMLQTWTGPMDKRAVYSQILIVPFAAALLSLGILVIVSVVGP